MREIFVPNTVCVLPITVFPLCNNNRRDAILAAMPRCNAQGIVGDEEEAVPAPERTPALRKRLETVAQRDAHRRGGSSWESGSPRESRSSRGSGSPRESGDVVGDDDEALPDNFQRTSIGFAYTAPTEEARDDDADDEDQEPLAQRQARVRSEVRAVSADAEREQPLPEIPAPPVRPAPTCPALKRKVWGSTSDDEE